VQEVAIVKGDGLTTHEIELTTGVLGRRKGLLGGEVNLSVTLDRLHVLLQLLTKAALRSVPPVSDSELDEFLSRICSESSLSGTI
jgi:hypothetical protein